MEIAAVTNVEPVGAYHQYIQSSGGFGVQRGCRGPVWANGGGRGVVAHGRGGARWACYVICKHCAKFGGDSRSEAFMVGGLVGLRFE